MIYVDLRQVRIQFLDKEDQDSASDSPVVMMDAFIRADPELDKIVPPFTIQLKDYCFVSVRIPSTTLNWYSASDHTNYNYREA